jgi:hypothetical protein
MAKMYRTSKGKMIDMDALRLQSEKSTAVGNMGVNGRGDKLGKGGKVEATVEQQARAYYRHNPNAAPKKVNLKEDLVEEEVKQAEEELEEITENMPEKKSKPKKKKTISKKKEVELEDGSIQIVDEDVEVDED